MHKYSSDTTSIFYVNICTSQTHSKEARMMIRKKMCTYPLSKYGGENLFFLRGLGRAAMRFNEEG